MNTAFAERAEPPHLVAFWTGPALRAIETACLASARRQGHALTLYCYRRPSGVPAGVELRDAREILPETEFARHANGSPAVYADRFRYEILRRGLGTWIDCDLYFLKPLAAESPYLFGFQDGMVINNAVLRLPSDCPVLLELLEIFQERTVPPWLPLPHRLAACWRLASRGRTGVSRMPWGTSGPHALTFLLRKHGLACRALAEEVLNPVPWPDADWIFDPGKRFEEMVTPQTILVHLWTSRLRPERIDAAPKGSFMRRLGEEARTACLDQ